MRVVFDPKPLQAAQRPELGSDGAERDLADYRAFYRLPEGFAQRLGCIHAAGYPLAAQLWSPPQPKATLIVLHGYYDHLGLYGHLLRWALAENFAVLGCDLPGHGLSGGARASIHDFAEYQEVLKALLAQAGHLQLPAPWHLVGQSTGAAIVLDRLLHSAPLAQQGRAILLAPLVRPRGWRRSWLSYQLLKPFVHELPRSFYPNSHDPAFCAFIEHIDPLQPKVLPTAWVGALARWIERIERAPAADVRPLIVQGEEDRTVDWRHNLTVLKAKFDRPELLLLPTGRHQLVNESRALREAYLPVLNRYLGG